MNRVGVVKIIGTTLRVLLAVVFLMSAIQKLTGNLDVARDHLDIAPWFWTLTAFVELAGVLGLLASLRFPFLATPAGLWISAIMVGAIATRLWVEDPPTDVFLEALLLAVALVAAVLGVRAGRTRQARVVRSGQSRMNSEGYQKERRG